MATMSWQSSVPDNCWFQALPGDRGLLFSLRSTEFSSAFHAEDTELEAPEPVGFRDTSGSVLCRGHELAFSLLVFKARHLEGPSNLVGDGS